MWQTITDTFASAYVRMRVNTNGLMSHPPSFHHHFNPNFQFFLMLIDWLFSFFISKPRNNATFWFKHFSILFFFCLMSFAFHSNTSFVLIAAISKACFLYYFFLFQVLFNQSCEHFTCYHFYQIWRCYEVCSKSTGIVVMKRG